MLSAKKFINKKQFIKFVSIISVIILVFFGLYANFFKNNKYDEIFKERKFFVLYLKNSRKQSDVLASKELVKNLGAGGEIICQDDIFYLTACVYLNKSDSTEILKSTSKNFPDSGVLNLTRKKVNLKNKYEIKNNMSCFKFLIYINSLIEKLCEFEIDFMTGKLTTKSVISSLVENKIELEEIINNFASVEENLKIFYKTEKLCLFYIENFLGIFYESSNKSSLICALTTNLVFAIHDLYEEI